MPKGSKKRTWKHSQEFYARIYGCTRDQIGRAVREGINPEDPSAIAQFLAQRTRTKIDPIRPAPTFHEEQNSVQIRSGNGQTVHRATGLAEGIRALQKAEAHLNEKYELAIEKGNPEAIRFWREEWTTVFDQLRRIEQVNPEIEREKGESVRLSEVEIFIHRVASAIREAIDAAPERVVHKLVGMDVPEMLEELKRENEIVLRHLVEWPNLLSD